MLSRMGRRVVLVLSAVTMVSSFTAPSALAQCRSGSRQIRSPLSVTSTPMQQRLVTLQQQQLSALVQQQLLALQQQRLTALVALARQQQLTALQQEQLAALVAILQQQNAAGPQLRAAQLIGR